MRRLAGAACLTGLTLAAPGIAQKPAPVGPELQVNTTAAGWQTAPAAAFDASGNFVTVWQSGGAGLAGTEDTDVFLQLWNADGTPRGPELLVNTTVAGCQGAPAVASAPDGSFVVVWQSQSQDGDGWGIFGQRFDATGAPVDGEIAVNATTAGDQQAPAVAYDPSGTFFTVAWESLGAGTTGWDILARQFASSGAPLSGEVLLNATATGDQRHPVLAVQPGGQLVAAWEGPDADGTGIYLRLFNSALSPLSGEVAANTATSGSQSSPALDCDGSGNCVVAWESSGEDGSASGIYARRFDRTLAPLVASEFQVNTTTAGLQAAPSVLSFLTGDFLIAWESAGQDAGSSGIFAQRYDFRIQPQGGEIQVNSYLPGAQRHSRLAAAATGAALALWESLDQDGDGGGVFAQRYALPGLSFFTVAPCRAYDSRNTNALTSGVLRTLPLPGVCGIPATARAVSVNLTVTSSTDAGNVTLFPGDAAAPTASFVNFSAGQTRANNAILTVARTGTGTVTAKAFVLGSGTVQLIVDVNGYFQ